VTPLDYLEAVKERLLTDALVKTFHIARERATLTDAYMRARLVLADDSQLEFSEYVQSRPDDTIEVATYSYHWADAQGQLIQRWDNTPHFPDLPNFPHHVHAGAGPVVAPGQPMTMAAVLDEIAARLA
jgi:hypothetical protein